MLRLVIYLCRNILNMSKLNVREIREKLALSQERFAKLLGVTTRTVQNWESGGVIPQSKQEILREIRVHPQIEQRNVNGNNTTTNNTTNNYSDCEESSSHLLGKALDEIAEQRKLVAKSQEQIDKLLAIIDKMQKEQ